MSNNRAVDKLTVPRVTDFDYNFIIMYLHDVVIN